MSRSTKCRICRATPRQSSSVCRYCSAERGLRRATSTVVSIDATGVRSSWDMSAAACFSRSNALRSSSSVPCSRSRIGASSRGSGSSADRGKRKSRDETWLTASVTFRSGTSPRPTIRYPPTVISKNEAQPIANSRLRKSESERRAVASWSARSPAKVSFNSAMAASRDGRFGGALDDDPRDEHVDRRPCTRPLFVAVDRRRVGRPAASRRACHGAPESRARTAPVAATNEAGPGTCTRLSGKSARRRAARRPLASTEDLRGQTRPARTQVLLAKRPRPPRLAGVAVDLDEVSLVGVRGAEQFLVLNRKQPGDVPAHLGSE